MDDAIAADREKHPGCHYNRSSQSSFQLRGDETTMTTIERVFRQCRGEKPIEIFRSESSGEGQMPEQPDIMGGTLGGMMGRGRTGGMGGRLEAEHGAGMLDDLFRGFFGVHPHHHDRQYRRQPAAPPHRSYRGAEERGEEGSDEKERRKQRFRRYDRQAEEV